MLSTLFPLLREAGRLIRGYSHTHTVRQKQDHSPVTEADMASHDYLCAALSQLMPDLPIISEETPIPDYQKRKNWARFWLLDPLDGTKEFIKGTGEYSICLALIEQNRPILGLIYGPEKDLFYYAEQGQGAFKQLGLEPPQKLYKTRPSDQPYRVLCSRFHHSNETQAYLDDLKETKPDLHCIHIGSALKFGALAEGLADCYPRLTPCYEWDVAAGDILLYESGYQLCDFKTHQPLVYNKPSLISPWFIGD